MSEYIKVKTVMKVEHLDCLVKALGDIEPAWAKPGVVEQHAGAGALLQTYLARDQRGLRANVIVRRAHVGPASNDVGFAVQRDGSVEAVIGDFDRGAGHYAHRAGARCGGTWLNRLGQHYAFRVAEKKGAEAGLEATKEVRADGSWKVVLAKRSSTPTMVSLGTGRIW